MRIFSLYLFFWLRGRNHEGRQILSNAFTSLDDEDARDLWQRSLVRYCLMQVSSGEDNHVRELDELLAQALTIAEMRGGQAEIATCWFARGHREMLAAYALRRLNFDRARAYLEQSLARFEILDDSFYMAHVSRALGSCYGYDVITMQ